MNYSIKIISPHTESGGEVKRWEKVSTKICDIDVMKTQMSIVLQTIFKGQNLLLIVFNQGMELKADKGLDE